MRRPARRFALASTVLLASMAWQAGWLTFGWVGPLLGVITALAAVLFVLALFASIPIAIIVVLVFLARSLFEESPPTAQAAENRP